MFRKALNRILRTPVMSVDWHALKHRQGRTKSSQEPVSASCDAAHIARSFDYHTVHFSRDEKRFLDRWLISYIEIDNGVPPRKREEERILAMLNGQVPANSQGMEWYLKWKAAGTAARQSNAVFEEYEITLESIATSIAGWKDRSAANAATLIAAILSTDVSGPLGKWADQLSDSTATIYDKSIDAAYIASHEGGSLHRLFDGGHSVGGMWEAVLNASPDDTLAQEVAAYVDSFIKDVVTANGLPFITIDKVSYDQVALYLHDALQVPKSWIADAASFNAVELFSTSLGVLALVLNWSSSDKEKFADMAITMGIAAAFSANPLLGLVALVALARALQGKRTRNAYTQLLRGAAQGGIGTGILLTAASVISGPAWIGIIVGISLSTYAKRKLGDKSAVRLSDWMLDQLKAGMKSTISPNLLRT